jgi:hypothetical protein
MLLRNLNQAEGLCNGTQLVITVLGDMVIERELMTGTHKGKSVLIPRISLTLKNNKWPFVLEAVVPHQDMLLDDKQKPRTNVVFCWCVLT